VSGHALDPASPTKDGGEHGPDCYDKTGTLMCGWPERHAGPVTETVSTPTDEPAAAVTPKSSKREILDRGLTSLIVGLSVIAVGLGILVFFANLHFQTVTSGSMRPTVSPGDVAITQSVPVDSLQVGDIIVFYPPGTTQAVMHRIVSLENGVIKTRGDANSVEDSWQIKLSGTTAYRMVAVAPFLGWLPELQRPALIGAGLLVGLAVLLELRKEVEARRKKSQPQA
jgi:signal peptidase I